MSFSVANPNIRCCFTNLLLSLPSGPHLSVCISKPSLHNDRDILHVTDAGFLLQTYLLYSCQFIWHNRPSHCNWFCTFQGNLVVLRRQKRTETVSYPRNKNTSPTPGRRAKKLYGFILKCYTNLSVFAH